MRSSTASELTAGRPDPRAVRAEPTTPGLCHHCGTPCPDGRWAQGDKLFCCSGCQMVFELLAENGLDHFYELSPAAGNRITREARANRFGCLDEPAVQRRLIAFSDGKISRVRFQVPAIHCLACVWLLENLFRLHPGVGQSQVNFPRKEVAISFEEAKLRLSELVGLLASIGYEPDLKLADLDQPRPAPTARRLWLQVGVAGFAFGNIMLLSLAAYLGLDNAHGPALKRLFGYLSLGLALPVVCYSAADYWRSAWRCVTHRVLTIDLPIALGIAAFFAQSVWTVLFGAGESYFDSLAGLVFFLLCGKVFQQRTYDRLAFDRDYKSFFPLSVVRKQGAREQPAALSELRVGDRLMLRHREMVPADAVLIRGAGVIDYSFVTGESEPVTRQPGEYLYAGGQQTGGAIEVEIIKPVSQSYLIALWNHEAFRKPRADEFQSLTNLFSRRFTVMVLGIAGAAALYWSFSDPARAVKAFTSVLIVACPCALALAAPFALGTAQRVLARRNIFLKNPSVLETMARVDAIVFDKTGTLTQALPGGVSYEGTPLTEKEQRSLAALARQSTHPLCARLSEALGHLAQTEPVKGFIETPGAGIAGRVNGHELWLGSRAWLAERQNEQTYSSVRSGTFIATGTKRNQPAPAGLQVPPDEIPANPHAAPDGADKSAAHLAINGQLRGVYRIGGSVRPQTGRMLAQLGKDYELALLSGDHARAREQFQALFGPGACLRFNQNPFHKLDFIRELQRGGRTVMMVGDGLNDAGALQQSQVGVAVVERVGAFSPASDVILEASWVPRLPEVLRFAKSAARIVRFSFLISTLYNVVGISIAARGLLSPVICAILMPLSSVTVVAVACGLAHWRGRRLEHESSLSL